MRCGGVTESSGEAKLVQPSGSTNRVVSLPRVKVSHRYHKRNATFSQTYRILNGVVVIPDYIEMNWPRYASASISILIVLYSDLTCTAVKSGPWFLNPDLPLRLRMSAST
jgi:hypothetical protein